MVGFGVLSCADRALELSNSFRMISNPETLGKMRMQKAGFERASHIASRVIGAEVGIIGRSSHQINETHNSKPSDLKALRALY